MVRVASIHQAATVVRFASHHEIPFTTRGGGYSTSGASITYGGIVLDLSKLRAVHVFPDSQTVTVEGGAVWADVDVAAAQHQLIVVGSTLNQIGVAGATLGGGYGWLTGQYGLVIDNLLWAKMILADGSIVTASETAHRDLFWGVRGAGQCFGVAVELGFRAHRQENHVFAGTLCFSPDKLPQIVAFANHFETVTDGKQGFWFGFTMQDSMAQCSILVVLFYNGSESEARQFFSPVLSLEPAMDRTQMLPYDGLNEILNTTDVTTRRDRLSKIDITYPDKSVGFRKSLRGSNITLPLDVDFVRLIYDEFNAVLTDHPQARDSRILFELLPNRQITKVANSATAFASRGPYYNVSSLFEWTEAHLDNEIRSLQQSLMDRIGRCAGITRQPGYNPSTHGTGLYANYAGRDVPVGEIFGDNLSRLRRLKEKYDAHNIFRKWHNLNKHDPPA
ncbi:uncharacterized protein TRUGW13939_10500 [Talaromyces rugulosus]|uniref:FAD-binding PCMH-type domain-containing protein n=1 Tax=Talaromyces rugulosus TaxID=121627 RepID=A0A7H8RA62_TALRU|nr:uncharacterized protein TRUGW13939_10500 [Talaromyces rugulosus]QKX63330.1 hypothetical protein TRUGW13939_10500 [Talaromyces rugulosus]